MSLIRFMWPWESFARAIQKKLHEPPVRKTRDFETDFSVITAIEREFVSDFSATASIEKEFEKDFIVSGLIEKKFETEFRIVRNPKEFVKEFEVHGFIEKYLEQEIYFKTQIERNFEKELIIEVSAVDIEKVKMAIAAKNIFDSKEFIEAGFNAG